ncbi:MAG: tRNA (adenosine(37)-N6)-dimethylallyltransferase MiaA [Planctomycetota bacterium]|nr:MAG: tRNA (adenosine(37)-N6)-dimethylallyltransferase MiaA [Planctomycetota bacterium]
MNPPIVVILGPTASGKTALSLKLAIALEGEIICADSMQVYRGMDIGTAKVSEEERAKVPHHLVDILSPDQSYSVMDFIQLAHRCVEEILGRKKNVFLVGGTALYIKRFLEGIESGPEANWEFRRHLQQQARAEGPFYLYHRLCCLAPERASKLHPKDVRRVIRALEVLEFSGSEGSTFEDIPKKYSFFLVGLDWPREELYRRIDRRVEEMFQQGLVEEVRRLQRWGFSRQARQALGYKEVLEALEGRYSLEEAKRRIQRNTRHFAKRQLSWFRKFQGVHWYRLEGEEDLERVFLDVQKEVRRVFGKGW